MSRSITIAVLGGGGHAKVVVTTLRDIGHESIEIYDDDPALEGQSLLGAPIRGPIEKLERNGVRQAVLAVGDNRARQRLDRWDSLEWITAVHPRAHVDSSSRLGPGTVVLAGAVVQPECVLGRHTIVNTGATIDHETVIADFAHIAPGAHLGGSVKVGEGALLGIGSAVLPGTEVGRWAIVGAGSVVLGSVAAGSSVGGNPARPLATGDR